MASMVRYGSHRRPVDSRVSEGSRGVPPCLVEAMGPMGAPPPCTARGGEGGVPWGAPLSHGGNGSNGCPPLALHVEAKVGSRGVPTWCSLPSGTSWCFRRLRASMWYLQRGVGSRGWGPIMGWVPWSPMVGSREWGPVGGVPWVGSRGCRGSHRSLGPRVAVLHADVILHEELPNQDKSTQVKPSQQDVCRLQAQARQVNASCLT